MTHQPAYLIDNGTLTLLLNGKSYSLTKDHPNYTKVLDALKSASFDTIPDLIDTRSAVRQWLSVDPDFTLTNDRVCFRGTPYNSAITDKVLRMIDAGHSPVPIFNFLRLVEKNPSAAARNELLLFCVANGFLIDMSGRIIAYKSVNREYMDIYSGTVFYKPFDMMTEDEKQKYALGVALGRRGNVLVSTRAGRTEVSMPRNAVDDNRNNTCSYGLHFASYEYASTWAGSDNLRLLAIAVSPADVVSIPSDYNNQKGRACLVVPIAEIADFSKLPNKEVYDEDDLFAASNGGCHDECYDDEPDNSAEIARKRAAIAKIEARMASRQNRINQIVSLGGSAEELEEEQGDDENLVEDIEAEILDLE